MPSPKFALMCLYATTIMMGVNGVFSKVIPLDAVTITGLRCVIAAGALVVFTLIQKQSLLFTRSRHYFTVLGLGVLMAIHWCSFFHSMQLSTVAIGILAHYSYPVITVIAEPLINKKAPALSDILAGVAVLCGVALMVPDWDMNSEVFGGVMFGLLSALTFGSRNILQRRWLQHESSGSVMFYQMLTVAIVTAPFIDLQTALALPAVNWQQLFLLGVISTAFAHTMIAFCLRALSAKTVSLVSCLQPPSAVLIAWMVVGEVPSANTALGGAVILAAALYESVKSGRTAPSSD